jgi:hypothetical protein
MSIESARPSRPTRTVLEEALAELENREQRLQPLVEEIADVKRALAILRKAIGGPTTPRLTLPRTAGTVAPRHRARERILTAVEQADGPITVGQIALTCDYSQGQWLNGVLGNMVTAGEIVAGDGGYRATR